MFITYKQECNDITAYVKSMNRLCGEWKKWGIT